MIETTWALAARVLGGLTVSGLAALTRRTVADGAIDNSDVDLAVSRDGTLYFVTMQFDRESRK